MFKGAILIAVAVFSATILAGCGAEEGHSSIAAASNGGMGEIVYCYGPKNGNGEGAACIIKFNDGATCTRSYDAYSESSVYSDCRGGKFDELGAKQAEPVESEYDR